MVWYRSSLTPEVSPSTYILSSRVISVIKLLRIRRPVKCVKCKVTDSVNKPVQYGVIIQLSDAPLCKITGNREKGSIPI